MSNLEKPSVKKFNFVEIFNNSDGKTSGSGFIGVIGSLFCMVVILAMLVIIVITLKSNSLDIDNIVNTLQSIMMYTFGLASIYAGLLGLRKWRGTITKDKVSLGDDDDDRYDGYGGYGGYGGYSNGQYGGYDNKHNKNETSDNLDI
jgi:hypothetical protein